MRRTKKRPDQVTDRGDFHVWLREPDLNRRPSGYEPDELPDCSIPRPPFYSKRKGCQPFPLKKCFSVRCLQPWAHSGTTLRAENPGEHRAWILETRTPASSGSHTAKRPRMSGSFCQRARYSLLLKSRTSCWARSLVQP